MESDEVIIAGLKHEDSLFLVLESVTYTTRLVNGCFCLGNGFSQAPNPWGGSSCGDLFLATHLSLPLPPAVSGDPLNRGDARDADQFFRVEDETLPPRASHSPSPLVSRQGFWQP
jgi:hypothetical protein